MDQLGLRDRTPAAATPRTRAAAPTPARPRQSGLARLLGLGLNLLLLFGVIGAGLGSGLAYGLLQKFSQDLPRLEMLADYAPSEMTTVHSRDGQVLDRFFLENRIVVPLAQIPQVLKNAFFSIEDSRFYEHHGIDMYGIGRAFVKNIKAGEIVEGASTITQQLVRTIFRWRERVYSRKLREMILAWKLEEQFTKDQILEMYFNEIYLGSGAYGVEAASRAYFGKSVQDVTLGEAAILASLPKSPTNYNPKQNPKRAKVRQKMVLDKMVDDGIVTPEEAAAAYAVPLDLQAGASVPGAAMYFVESVRQRVEKQLGSETVHRGGLHIQTTLDLELQQFAERAIRKGLRDYDKRHGYRGPLAPLAPVVELGNSAEPGQRLLARVQKLGPKLVELSVMTTRSGRRPDAAAAEDIVELPGVIEISALRQRWVGKVIDKLGAGDLVLVEVLDAPEGGPLKLALEQEPEVQGALLCLDPQTGEVLAMVGGYDFTESEFNRAIQAKRQPGSAFKIFVYLTALQHGLTPATLVYDTAVVESQGGEDGKLWKPQNYYGKFFGKMALRDAFAKSLNPVSVRLIEEVGIDPTIRNARRLGVTAELSPDLSLGLGSSGVSLLEMTAAYGTMAAGGRYARPHFIRRIEGSEGQMLDEQVPQLQQAVAPEYAFVMTRLLLGVVQHGTAKAARRLQRPIAGKTGTTDDHHDAWFLGYSPQIVTGVWVGFDNMQRSLGKGETGAQAALPIWLGFMENALKRYEPLPFPVPANVVQAGIDPESGLLATPQCHRVSLETFVQGTAPTRACDKHSVSVTNFDQLDSVAAAESGPQAAAGQPAKVVDPSEITAPKPGEKEEDEEEH